MITLKYAKLLGILYLLLPVLIFFGGWLRPVVALAGCILLVISIVKIISSDWRMEGGKALSLKSNAMILAISVSWVALSGIAGFGFQNTDLDYRNAIFHDLVAYDWPVDFGNGRLMVYYFAFWLPPALVGKVFGSGVANFALFLWTTLGVWITLSLFAMMGRKMNVLVPALLFVFFSGMDIVGFVVGKFSVMPLECFPSLGKHIEWWFGYVSAPGMQYSSFTTQLFWVFNQAIPAWIATLLLLERKRFKGSVAIFFLALPLAPFPFVGLLPVILYKFMGYLKERPWLQWKGEFLGLLVCDALPLLAIYPVFSSFYGVNKGAGELRYFFDRGFSLYFVSAFLLFLILEFGFIAAILMKAKFYSKELAAAVIILSVIPFFVMGGNNDFCMRASIPALVWLAVLVLRLYDKLPRKNQVQLIIVLLIGSVTPLQEIYRSAHAIAVGRPLIANHIGSLSNPKVLAIPHNNFMSDSYEGSTFAKYLMKR